MVCITAGYDKGRIAVLGYSAFDVYGEEVVRRCKMFRIIETFTNFAPKLETMEKEVFKLIMLEEAFNFVENLPQAAADKIYHNIYRVRGGERNRDLFKKLENSDIWEFRTLYNKTAYRLFAFWDKEQETMVVATHGLIKKTQKTPQKDIAKAERLRLEYFNNKNK